MTPEEKRKRIDMFILNLSLIRNEAMELGFYLTEHKIKEAVRQVGWELENMITKGDVSKKQTFGDVAQ